MLAASADIEAGRYGLAAVVGIEQMRNVPGEQAAQYIGGPAMWAGHEYKEARFPWPRVFSDVADEYDRRFGLKQEHLARIAEINFGNGRRNRNAQTRRWQFNERSFTQDEAANPTIEGRIRKQDCGQITDGAAIVFLASEARAREHAKRLGIDLDVLPYIKGWGHRTAPITYAAKVRASAGEPYVFPHVRGAVTDAFKRAGIAGVEQLDGIETHDCFTSTEYMAIDHFGITAPGQSWRAIEEGEIEIGGRIPVNASGGLIGAGHPVGAPACAWRSTASSRRRERRGVSGGGREDVRDAEHRRQRHDDGEPDRWHLSRARQAPTLSDPVTDFPCWRTRTARTSDLTCLCGRAARRPRIDVAQAPAFVRGRVAIPIEHRPAVRDLPLAVAALELVVQAAARERVPAAAVALHAQERPYICLDVRTVAVELDVAVAEQVLHHAHRADLRNGCIDIIVRSPRERAAMLFDGVVEVAGLQQRAVGAIDRVRNAQGLHGWRRGRACDPMPRHGFVGHEGLRGCALRVTGIIRLTEVGKLISCRSGDGWGESRRVSGRTCG